LPREYPAIDIDASIGRARVISVLKRLVEIRGLPEVITMDNGSEFTGHYLD
jgi:putative transposase